MGLAIEGDGVGKNRLCVKTDGKIGNKLDQVLEPETMKALIP